jgi:hypothetical protein
MKITIYTLRYRYQCIAFYIFYASIDLSCGCVYSFFLDLMHPDPKHWL